MSTQPIKCKWMGLSSGGDNFASCCFWKYLENSFASCFFGDTWEILLLLVLLEALFGRQFSWWKVTFFLSSFLLVLFG